MKNLSSLSLFAAVAAIGMSALAVVPTERAPEISLGPNDFPRSRERSRSTRSKNDRNRKKMADASKRANRRK